MRLPQHPSGGEWCRVEVSQWTGWTIDVRDSEFDSRSAVGLAMFLALFCTTSIYILYLSHLLGLPLVQLARRTSGLVLMSASRSKKHYTYLEGQKQGSERMLELHGPRNAGCGVVDMKTIRHSAWKLERLDQVEDYEGRKNGKQ